MVAREVCPRRLLAGLLILALAGCSGPKGPPQGSSVPIEVTIAQPLVIQSIDWDSYTGRLAPVEEVDVRARVSGYLVSHHFEEGQIVNTGDLLFVIDKQPYEAALAEASAALTEAQAKKRQSDAEIGTARARKQQATARLDLANAQLRRAQPLVSSGAVSRDEYDEYVNEVKQAEADGYSADAEILAAEAAASAADAAIVTAEASQRAAQLDLDYCTIEAPITGKISNRMVTEGNLISGNSFESPLTTIVSFNPIHANFDFNEQALLKYIRLDQASKREQAQQGTLPVYMALADEEGYPHRGYIDFFDNRVDQSTGSMRARAIFPNDDQIFVPGIFVRIRVPGSPPGMRVHLPEYAIATDQSSKIVFVVGEGNKIETRPIKVGRRSKGLMVITEGLDGSEWVVIQGLQRCQPGAEVQASKEVIEPLQDDGLPDQFELVSPSEYLEPKQTAGAPE